ncbi:MAG: hypothetical protein KZQ64_00405 [gamma proteobacterium symbiont of Bathyaustriella thionipta]|nr:hypothetical protein [gamma proteobacterium symbiont of Bathyaustriella thionipta]MCU7951162.1 hypothetical protein [gamma proteobacterium symbiont of Bathyaustriella thionipta]MCU7951869.1 hypothetical protein [gamma proteobacterium symbiont of Bathyaustriella thionipta]MCU7957672.1 hypothetical protein [gamma proteobacterium symbiont of Bathyaustriella thionipta]MCU7968910.1 hypothetical protein [gamma proteobacterium symbiont of Bathyaustriella thionipta]
MTLIIKKLRFALLLTLMFFMGLCNVAAETGVKWHPGHYILGYGTLANKVYLKNTFKSIRNIPQFTGIQMRVNWAEIETSKGVYNTALIEGALELAEKYQKRLVIQIMDRCWNCPENTIVPDYITTDPIYSGGVILRNNKDLFVRIFDPVVMKQFNKMIKWLGKTFDSNNYFEAINFAETAFPCRHTPECVAPAYTNGLIERLKNAKESFIHTNVIQYANWLSQRSLRKGPKAVLGELMDEVKEHKAGWGGPDIIPYDAPGVAN